MEQKDHPRFSNHSEKMSSIKSLSILLLSLGVFSAPMAIAHTQFSVDAEYAAAVQTPVRYSRQAPQNSICKPLENAIPTGTEVIPLTEAVIDNSERVKSNPEAIYENPACVVPTSAAVIADEMVIVESKGVKANPEAIYENPACVVPTNASPLPVSTEVEVTKGINSNPRVIYDNPPCVWDKKPKSLRPNQVIIEK